MFKIHKGIYYIELQHHTGNDATNELQEMLKKIANEEIKYVYMDDKIYIEVDTNCLSTNQLMEFIKYKTNFNRKSKTICVSKVRECCVCKKHYVYNVKDDTRFNYCSSKCHKKDRLDKWKEKYGGTIAVARQKKQYVLACELCGAEIMSGYAQKKYCNKEHSGLGAKMSRLKEKTCKCCGESFIGNDSHRYCSIYCSCISHMAINTVNNIFSQINKHSTAIKYYMKKYPNKDTLPPGILNNKPHNKSYDVTVKHNTEVWNKYKDTYTGDFS